MLKITKHDSWYWKTEEGKLKPVGIQLRLIDSDGSFSGNIRLTWEETRALQKLICDEIVEAYARGLIL